MMVGTSLPQRCQLLELISLILLQSTNAIINETFSGYLFTIPDQPAGNLITQSSANQWCQNNKNTLLEINDSQLQAIVAQFISARSGSPLFMGYTEIFTSGMRNSTGPWTWVNGQRYAGSLIQNQTTIDYAYVYLVLNQSSVSYIADKQPANKRGYICESVTGNSCTGGFKYNERCYTSSTEQLSWFGARNKCLGDGGDLASFDFNSLNGSWINPSTPYWIGLRRQWWSWQSSGSEIKYTNWQDGRPMPSPQSPQPPYNCLCLMPSQRDWSECDCTQNFQFICLRAVNNPFTPANSSPATASPISVNENTTNPVKSSSSVPLGVGLHGAGLGGLLIIILTIVFVA